MKTLSLFFALGLLGAGACRTGWAAEPSVEQLFRHHFLGEEKISRQPGGTRAKELWNLPQRDPFVKSALEPLAAVPARVWPERLSNATEQVVGWVTPLLEDLVRAESYSDIAGPTNRVEAALAVRLGAERADLWSTNLWQLAHLATGKNPRRIQAAEFAGWEVETDGARTVQLLRNESWLVLGIGGAPLEAVSRMLRLIDRGEPKTEPAWLELEVDLPALGFWLRPLRSELWPRVTLALIGDNENLRTTGRLTFRKPIPWTFEPWRIPTNSIVEPIVSFTVGQGIAPFLQHWFENGLGLAKLPNQFCMWGQPMEQRQLVATFPIKNSTNAVQTLARAMPEGLSKLFRRPVEDFFYISNRNMLAWQFLAPPAFPYIIPWDEGDQEYLLAAVLPVIRETNPPPTALFAQLGNRQNLIYYDWELTDDRALFATQVYQLYDIKEGRDLAPATHPARQWLIAVLPKLGNSVTELTRSGSKELALERKSHLGLTGFELVSLIEWISSPRFPLEFRLSRPTAVSGETPGPAPAGGP